VGYASDSASDTYRMFTPSTNAIHCTRDVQWLKKMFYAPDKPEAIQAADSVELITKQGKIPIRTTSKEIAIIDFGDDTKVQVKPTVTFKPGSQVEVVQKEWVVSFDPDDEETLSLISKSVGQPWDSPNSAFGTQKESVMDLGRVEEEEEINLMDSLTLEAEIEFMTPKPGKEETHPDEVQSAESVSSVLVPRRSGRARQTNIRLTGYELDNVMGALAEEEDPYAINFLLIGAGIGGGFEHTQQLIARTFNQVLQQENDDEMEKWADAVDVEHQRMIDNEVWVPVLRNDHPDEIPITTTWSMKLRSNGVMRPRVNARGFEQIAHVHYDPDTKAAPVVNMTTFRVVLILQVMNICWIAKVLDVKGAFLKGKFEAEDKPMALEVPQGFLWIYLQLGEEMEKGKEQGNTMSEIAVKERMKELLHEWRNKPAKERVQILKAQKNPRGGVKTVILRLLRTLYGSVQAARAFWKEMLQAFKAMGYSRADADPCLYHKWDTNGNLCLWMSWIDDCLIVGDKDVLDRDRKIMMEMFDCDDVGMATEYVGTKIDSNQDTMILTQPVLIQSFVDEFGIKSNCNERLPAKPGQVLASVDTGKLLNKEMAANYRKGVGKLIYLSRWTRPDILNAVRELSRHCKSPSEIHYEAMIKCMSYCVATGNKGLKLHPKQKWDGSKDFWFTVMGYSDSNYSQCPDTRKSVSGNTTTLEGAPVITRSVMQDTVKLSVTEAELDSATSNVQDMLHVKNILESLGLKVKVPMILRVDNQGVRDIINNWSVGGRTRHVHTKQLFLRELKEKGILKVEYEPGKNMRSDLFTKNLPGPNFNTHIEHYIGKVEEVLKSGDLD
jgi:hypothetical protein